MKGIRHENKICRSGQFGNLVGVTRDELTIVHTAFHEAMLRNL